MRAAAVVLGAVLAGVLAPPAHGEETPAAGAADAALDTAITELATT